MQPQQRTHHRRDRRLAAMVRRRGDDCHLCGEMIDYDLPPGHPQAFEADHVIPWAAGGTSTLDNLAASHRLCNQRKGDRAAASSPVDSPTGRGGGCPLGHCDRCNGVHHNPLSGVTFVTARRW